MDTDWTTDGDDVVWSVSPQECRLSLTLDCGQCFRFEREGDTFRGAAHGRLLTMRQDETGIRFFQMSAQEFSKTFAPYFDLSTDYRAIRTALSDNPTLKTALSKAEGIRVLRQEGFETLVSFIISQNNNIPRIKKSIRLLCERYGKPLGEGFYAFPSAETLASLNTASLAGLSLGYRDRYILDASRKVSSGEIALQSLETDELGKARETLRKICGVGPKVAECVLLFGFGRHECVPMDTWMKKVMAKYYPNGFPAAFHAYAGIAQQYLFYYARRFDSF